MSDRTRRLRIGTCLGIATMVAVLVAIALSGRFAHAASSLAISPIDGDGTSSGNADVHGIGRERHGLRVVDGRGALGGNHLGHGRHTLRGRHQT